MPNRKVVEKHNWQVTFAFAFAFVQCVTVNRPWGVKSHRCSCNIGTSRSVTCHGYYSARVNVKTIHYVGQWFPDYKRSILHVPLVSPLFVPYKNGFNAAQWRRLQNDKKLKGAAERRWSWWYVYTKRNWVKGTQWPWRDLDIGLRITQIRNWSFWTQLTFRTSISASVKEALWWLCSHLIWVLRPEDARSCRAFDSLTGSLDTDQFTARPVSVECDRNPRWPLGLQGLECVHTDWRLIRKTVSSTNFISSDCSLI